MNHTRINRVAFRLAALKNYRVKNHVPNSNRRIRKTLFKIRINARHFVSLLAIKKSNLKFKSIDIVAKSTFLHTYLAGCKISVIKVSVMWKLGNVIGIRDLTGFSGWRDVGGLLVECDEIAKLV